MQGIHLSNADSSAIFAHTRKVSIIREEFVALTGHPYQAILLNQLFFWNQRNHNKEGWIYKSAIDFVEETMIKVSKWTFYRRMKTLIDNEWVESKENTNCRWDKTTSYRLNIQKIKNDLQKLGFDLPQIFREYPLKPAETSKLHAATPTLQVAPSKLHAATSKNKDINKKENKDVFLKEQEDSPKGIQDLNLDKEEVKVISIWRELHPTDDKEVSTEDVDKIFTDYFGKDISKWREFCKQVSETPYLQGENEKSWKVSLQWLSIEKNILRVLESFMPTSEEERLYKEAKNHVDGIADPLWKEICDELLHQWKRPGAEKDTYDRKKDLKFFLSSNIWEYLLVNHDSAIIYVADPHRFSWNRWNASYRRHIESILDRKYPSVRSHSLAEYDLQSFERYLVSSFEYAHDEDKKRLEFLLEEVKKRKNG